MPSVVFDSTVSPDLIKRMSATMSDQTKSELPMISEGWFPFFDRFQVQGRVLIRAGGTSTSGAIADGGATLFGSFAPVYGKYDGKILYTGASIGKQAADMTDGIEDGVDLMKDAFEGAREDIDRLTARVVLGSQLASPATTTTANSSTTVEVADPAGMEIKQRIDIYRSTTLHDTVYITSMAPGATPGANWTITFVGTGTGGSCAASWATTDTIWLHGTGPSGSGAETIVGLNDVIANANLYDTAVTVNGWRSFVDSTNTTLSREALDDLATQRYRQAKRPFDFILCNSINEQRLARLEEEYIRYTDPDGGLDRRGSGRLAYRGKPVIVDETPSSTHLYFCKKGAFKIHRFKKWEVDGKAEWKESKDTHDLYVKMSAYMNGRCERRRDFAAFTALAA